MPAGHTQYQAWVLRSLKPIRKEAPIVTRILRRTSPDPGVGSPVELSGRDTRGLFHFISVGKTLPCQGIAPEQAPPAFLQVQPTGSSRNEDVMEPGMLSHPGAGLGTAVTGEVVGDDEDVACGIVRFDVRKQRDVVRRVTRSGTPGQLLAIAHA